MPVNFTGQLNANEIFSAIYNMIISQQVFSDNINDTKSTLVDEARVDGSLYGDTKLYYATDVLKSVEWGADAETANLLQTHRPPSPKCQEIVLDVFRQIALTVDDYMTKRAWGTEGAFSEFNGVMRGWIGDTKRVYDSTTYNAFVGTVESTVGRQNLTVDVTSVVGDATGEPAARLEGGAIAEFIANLLVDLEDVSRDFNDYKYLRSSAIGNLKFIWNSKAVSKIEKRDLPTIYHKEIMDKFAEHTLPARYFGIPINTTNLATYSAATPAAGKPINSSTGAYTPGTNNANGTLRARSEQDIIVSGVTTHVFAGDEIPANTTVTNATIGAGLDIYIEDNTILFKVIHKRSIPYMSAFEVGTSFFNPKALNENNYLTWGHNTLDYLANYPMITVRKK